MRKNKMMRLASALLVAVLLTTCAISGTFAKYVTAETGSDSARVAKWGVTIEATGDMFETQEEGSVGGVPGKLTVKSSTKDKLVAPGMSGTMAAIAVKGSPEVAVRITHVATVTISGWAITGDDFYCPLIVTVNSNELNGLSYDSAAEFAAAIKGAIDAHTVEYEAGTDLTTNADEVDVSWRWNFEESGEQTNVKDTLVADVNATIEIAITTTVTQID